MADSTASNGSTGGGLILFKLNESVYSNRPLTLEIFAPGANEGLERLARPLGGSSRLARWPAARSAGVADADRAQLTPSASSISCRTAGAAVSAP